MIQTIINFMSFKIRSSTATVYRLFFISLFLLLGVTCIGSVCVDHFSDINIFTTDQQDSKEAFYATGIFMGILGIVTASMMIFLLQERRSPVSDRRQQSQPLDFIDRRTATDRRTD